jgi:predicted nucleotidyltransferase
MELDGFQAIARVLHDGRVECIVVGGMAVVAHGYGRMTFDIDLVIRLDKENIVRAFSALSSIGYQPRVPVTAEQFADTEIRAGWIRDKGMMVLNLWSERFRDTPVDIFVTEPFDFTKVYETALTEVLPDGTPVRIVDLGTLIDMKKAAGREKDRDDIRNLEILRDET